MDEKKDGICELLDIMRTLRSEGGCPWDREQTLESLKPFLLEECYETLEVQSGAARDHREELGDLLFQIVFQTQLRDEQGSFNFDDVARGIAQKLRRRHPHVFNASDQKAPMASAEVARRWEDIKSQEKPERQSLMDGIPNTFPALVRAQKLGGRAARIGFDWPNAQTTIDKVEEEVLELKDALEQKQPDAIQEELGDLMFALCQCARKLGLDAEQVLSNANRKFERRFRGVETLSQNQGGQHDLAALEKHWETVKSEEKRLKSRETE